MAQHKTQTPKLTRRKQYTQSGVQNLYMNFKAFEQPEFLSHGFCNIFKTPGYPETSFPLVHIHQHHKEPIQRRAEESQEVHVGLQLGFPKIRNTFRGFP